MTRTNESANGWRGMPWRAIGWGGAALLLLIPLATGAPWTLSDFILMGVFLGGAGLMLELAMMASRNMAFRLGAILAVLTAFLLIWVNGAVGFLGDENNPANLMFFGVLAVAVLGACIAGFRSAGMAAALFATAGAQIAVGVIALVWRMGSPGYHGVYEAVMGTSVFAGLWLLSAAFFRHAARHQADPAAG
jgi:hypothetical protein